MSSFQDACRNLLKDRFSLFLVFTPIFVIAMIFMVFKDAFVRDLPIGIVDMDRTSLSRNIAFDISSMPNLKIYKTYGDLKDAKDDLSIKKIYAIAVLPKDLEKNVKLGIHSEINLYINAQLVLLAKSVETSFRQIATINNAILNTTKILKDTQNITIAKSKSSPILLQITPLYNSNTSYVQFLLVGVLPCFLILVSSMLMINLLSNSTSLSFSSLCGNIALNLCIFSAWWVAIHILYFVLGIGFDGSYLILFIGWILCLLGYIGISLVAYLLLSNHTRSISIMVVYCTPSFAFAGITFPSNSFYGFASFWHQILPISHYLQLYLSQSSYMPNIFRDTNIFLNLIYFMPFLLLGILIYIYRLRLSRQGDAHA